MMPVQCQCRIRIAWLTSFKMDADVEELGFCELDRSLNEHGQYTIFVKSFCMFDKNSAMN